MFSFLCTALSDLNCFCDLPITFPAMLTILECLFLLFTLKLLYHAVMLNDKILSSRQASVCRFKYVLANAKALD